MADFGIAVALTIQHEGGYVNNPNDSGGRTKYGITQRDLAITMPGVDIFDITAPQAAEWYRTATKPERYNNLLYWQINQQDIANKVFDMGVLAGVRTAIKCLQRALGLPLLAVDGLFGPNTLETLNYREPIGVLVSYRHLLNTHFEAVVAANPQDAGFLAGWERRVSL